MLETRASDRDSEVVSEEAKLSELIESNGNVTITLSETERLVLSLFDQLEEIELETSLNHALTSGEYSSLALKSSLTVVQLHRRSTSTACRKRNSTIA